MAGHFFELFAQDGQMGGRFAVFPDLRRCLGESFGRCKKEGARPSLGCWSLPQWFFDKR